MRGFNNHIFGLTLTWRIGPALLEQFAAIARGDHELLEALIQHGLDHITDALVEYVNNLQGLVQLADMLDSLGVFAEEGPSEDAGEDVESAGIEVIDLDDFLQLITGRFGEVDADEAANDLYDADRHPGIPLEEVDPLVAEQIMSQDVQTPADDERREPYVVLTVDGPNPG